MQVSLSRCNDKGTEKQVLRHQHNIAKESAKNNTSPQKQHGRLMRTSHVTESGGKS